MYAKNEGATSCLECGPKEMRLMPIIHFASVIKNCGSFLCHSKRTVRGLAN